VVGNYQFFKKGDIILEINGRSASRDNLWYNMGGTQARVSVWRNGNIVESQVKVLEL
jgi:S1-C subfamily serine protease